MSSPIQGQIISIGYTSPMFLSEPCYLTLTCAPLGISNLLIVFPKALKNVAFTRTVGGYSYRTNIDPSFNQTPDHPYLGYPYSNPVISHTILPCSHSQQAPCHACDYKTQKDIYNWFLRHSIINYNLWRSVLHSKLPTHLGQGLEQIDASLDANSTIPVTPGLLCLPEEYLFAGGNDSISWGPQHLDWKKCVRSWPIGQWRLNQTTTRVSNNSIIQQ